MRVGNTLFREHDLKLVLLAAIICIIGAVVTLNVSDRAAGPRRFVWVVLLSICAGVTCCYRAARRVSCSRFAT